MNNNVGLVQYHCTTIQHLKSGFWCFDVWLSHKCHTCCQSQLEHACGFWQLGGVTECCLKHLFVLMGVLKESDTDLLAVTLTSLSVRSGGGGEIKSYLNYAQCPKKPIASIWNSPQLLCERLQHKMFKWVKMSLCWWYSVLWRPILKIKWFLCCAKSLNHWCLLNCSQLVRIERPTN